MTDARDEIVICVPAETTDEEIDLLWVVLPIEMIGLPARVVRVGEEGYGRDISLTV